MVEYKHYENEAVRMTSAEDIKIGPDPESGIKIKTEKGEFTFFPSVAIKDLLGDPILYVKFNRKEKLVLYHITEHSESKQAAEKLKTFSTIVEEYGEDWAVCDIMHYIKEIEKLDEELKEGKIVLKDGIHPSMKEAIKEG